MNRSSFALSEHKGFFPSLGEVLVLKNQKIMVTSEADMITYVILLPENVGSTLHQKVMSHSDVLAAKSLGIVGGQSFRNKKTRIVYRASFQVYTQGNFLKFHLVGDKGEVYSDVNDFFDDYERLLDF